MTRCPVCAAMSTAIALFTSSPLLSAPAGQHPNVVSPYSEFGTYGLELGTLNSPTGVAVTSGLDIIVSDTYNHRIAIYDSQGKIKRLVGKRGSGEEEFSFPAGMAVDDEDSVYIADAGNNRVVICNYIDKCTKIIVMRPERDGISKPAWVAVNRTFIAVSDAEAPKIVLIRRSDSGDRRTISIPSPFESLPVAIEGLAITDDSIIAADGMGSRLLRINIATGSIESFSGWGSFAGLLANPTALSTASNLIYVADRINHRIQVFDAKSLTFLGQWARHPPTGHEGGGRLHYPTAIAVDRNNRLAAVCEPVENRCQTFLTAKLTEAASGVVNDDAWWNKEGRFHYGSRIAAAGDLAVVTEQDTHAALIFDLSSGSPALIKKVGGFGTEIGRFVMPSGIHIDPAAGVVAISDRGNNRIQEYQIRKASDSTGRTAFSAELRASYDLKQRFAGLTNVPASYSLSNIDPGPQFSLADGRKFLVDVSQGGLVQIGEEYKGIALSGMPAKEKAANVAPSPDGQAYFAVDIWNHKVRKYNQAGTVLKEWGRPGPDKDAFVAPFGVAVDDEENVWVTDTGKHSIKKWSSDGQFIAEFGGYGVGTDQFYKPKGIAFDSKRRRILVNDFANHRAKVLDLNGKTEQIFGIGEEYVPRAPQLVGLTPSAASITFPQAALFASPVALPPSSSPVRVPTVDGKATVEVTPPLGGYQLHIPSTLGIRLENAPANAEIRVSAEMPAHGHGLTETPDVSKNATGATVSNLRFEMPGTWHLYFDLQAEGVTRRAVLAVEVR